ncbi:MAG: HPr family phosphocarrier protein [Gammaproteobacteria bacterium]|nr:HPr family phosphocarrier protein [Gammaproteobacteria bacterium]
MKRRAVTLINKLGLHARAAASFVKIASGFDCDISVANNGKKVSGKSIMGMMMLAAAKGNTIEIVASGPEEEAAVAELESLVLNRFGEDE